ncbi:MAG: prealbumin-like fold domain-containing protein [Bacilli bacterium]|nr:prealbumin-like fold domain-containing protein [Bacilli bacterium]
MKKIFTTIILLTSIFLFNINNTYALTTTLEPIENVYYQMTSINYSLMSKEEYTTVGNNLVYCLDPKKKVYSNLEYNTVEDIDLSDEIKDRINLIGYYGFEYINHNNYKYYLAAQELIWNVVEPNIKIMWLTKTADRVYNKINVDLEKKEIQALIDNHYNNLSLNNSTYKLSLNETIKLYDDDLSTYTISDSLSTIVSKNNELSITKKTLEDEIITLTKYIGNNQEPVYYKAEGYQTLFYPGVNTTITNYINLTVPLGSIKLSLKDLDNNSLIGNGLSTLANSKYTLYDKDMNIIKDINFNNEVVLLNDLQYGQYYLKEKQSGYGYQLDTNIYPFEINKDNDFIELDLFNKIIEVYLTIKKTYDLEYNEENAEFKITDSFNNEYILTTDINGIASINLPYNHYIIEQISGKKYYKLIDTFEININSFDDLYYELNTNKIVSNLIVYNIDSSNNELIKDLAKFKLFDVEEDKYVTISNLDEIYTNNGLINYDNIHLGKYILEQVESCYYYKINTEKIYFELTSEDKDIYIANDFDYYTFSINLLDEKDNKIEEATFEIYSNQDIIYSGGKRYSKDELMQTVTKYTATNLPKGSYYIIQKTTKDGYKIDESIYTINVLKDNEITIHNYPIKVDIPLIEEIKVESDIITEENKIAENIQNSEEKKYIKIPDTAIKEVKLNPISALLIILMGYIILKYAKA